MPDKNMRKTEEALRHLAEMCMEPLPGERAENRWLKERYEEFRRRHGGIGKAEADVSIYRTMYGAEPEKPSDVLKIRYWRTGRHLPINREQCEGFGKAMELSENHARFLLQGYFDRSDRAFETETEDAVYQERRALLEELKKEYLDKIPPMVRLQLYQESRGMEQSLRHLYYSDAKRYLNPDRPEDARLERHFVSISYDSEFRRQMKLLGEIPRRTMIRHILIFSVPYISRELLSSRLSALGYLPLDENHTQTDGSRLDLLVMGFLKLYEETCTGKAPETCAEWFRRAYAILDAILKEHGADNLRFFYFKTIR